MATRKWKLRLHISQVANQARSYASLGSMKGLGILLLPHGGMLLHSWVNRRTLNSPVPIYTPEWREHSET